jgi:hypothetical protein
MKFREVIYGLLTEDQEGVYKKHFSDVERKTFIRIADADPKTKIIDNKIIRLGSYYPFLINMYRNGNLKFEDLPKATEYLELVYKYQMKIGQMKINSIPDLYDIVKDKIAKTKTTLASLIEALDPKEYEIKHNGDSWFVVVPKSEKASSYLGVNTEWCTAWGDYSLNPEHKDRSCRFSSYSPQGPLYIIVNKENENDKYQLHFPSNQLKNPADNEVSNRPKFFNERLEVKKLFFPSLYISNPDLSDVKSELAKGKKFLDQSDLTIYRESVYREYGGTNPFVTALNNEDEDELATFLTDESANYSISGGNLEIEVKSLPSSVEGYDDSLRTLRSWHNDAYNSVSESEYDSYRYEAQNILSGYLSDYYEKNKAKLIDLFGFYCRTYEKFLEFAENTGIYKNENIRDEYIDKFTEGTAPSLETAIDTIIKEYEGVLELETYWGSDKVIKAPVEKLIEFISEKEIYSIDSLEDFIRDYMDYYDLPDSDYVEYPEYDYEYPSQEVMDNAFDDYFDKKHEEFFDDEETGCKEVRDRLIKIFEKYFTDQGVFENEFVRIELKQPWFQNFTCENGVNIKLYNKKTNKTEEGSVQVDNLVNHMQIEPLFERLSFKSILKDII